jgi:hypothetical protein
VGEFLVGGGLVLADAHVAQRRNAVLVLDRVGACLADALLSSALVLRRRAQLLADLRLAQGDDADEPVVRLQQPIGSPALSALSRTGKWHPS